MTIRGKWDEASTKRLIELREIHGRDLVLIGRLLNRDHISVGNRLALINMTEEQRHKRNSRIRIWSRKFRKTEQDYREAHTQVRIPEHVLADREARKCAEPRDLAGMLFGDPPRGYSALERRA